jgi:FAD/FMN-containing dehydrogenase
MVVRPADAVQVAEVVRVCIDHAVAVVPQGGNTGLVGGGVPRGGEVLLSTRRLNQIGRVDEITATCSSVPGRHSRRFRPPH